MATTTAQMPAFLAALSARGRAAAIPESADAYGWLVGSWELDVVRYWAADVSSRRLKGEAHFAWVLEGLVLQDVWIMPPRSNRTSRVEKKMNMYGTTVRAWDASIEAWRITWINPAGDHFEQQIGRRVGPDVVQLGVRPDGTPTRWRFTEIERDAFHWLGESLQSDAATWLLEGEFRARRLRATSS